MNSLLVKNYFYLLVKHLIVLCILVVIDFVMAQSLINFYIPQKNIDPLFLKSVTEKFLELGIVLGFTFLVYSILMRIYPLITKKYSLITSLFLMLGIYIIYTFTPLISNISNPWVFKNIFLYLLGGTLFSTVFQPWVVRKIKFISAREIPLLLIKLVLISIFFTAIGKCLTLLYKSFVVFDASKSYLFTQSLIEYFLINGFMTLLAYTVYSVLSWLWPLWIKKYQMLICILIMLSILYGIGISTFGIDFSDSWVQKSVLHFTLSGIAFSLIIRLPMKKSVQQ